ncbi:MAG TPA: epoxide hydrolase [Polyangia bacterium]|nr:epoxide hydrolase [Polyangia bacterium]
MKTTPFRIDVDQSVLEDLRRRLAATRWPDSPHDAGWGLGTDLAFMRKLADHWRERYDWRAQERALNAHPQFTANVDGTDLHFVHVRGKGQNPTPLLLIHAYPDSFYRFHKAIPFLTDPTAHGGDSGLSFDVVVPSLPGFGFSEHTSFGTDTIGDKLAALMKGLGYGRYIAGGGDGPIPISMSHRHADHVIGIYTVDVGYPDGQTDFAALSAPEAEFAQWIQGWWMREGAFNMIQSTKPQSLAFALNDSPVGLAAWLMILFASLAPDKIQERFTLDELITNAMIYWVTGTIGSSMRSYLETARETYGNPAAAPKPAKSPVPAAMARMPLDAPVPREWAERRVNLVQWTEPARGGHHSSWEVPELFTDDLRRFAATLATRPNAG